MADSAHMRIEEHQGEEILHSSEAPIKRNSSAHMGSTREKNGSLETMKKSKRAQMSLGQNFTKIKEDAGTGRHSGFPRIHF